MYLWSVRECVLEAEVEEKVQGEVCAHLLEAGLKQEIQLCAMEAITQAKQLKMAQLEALRQKFLQQQLRKNWNRYRGLQVGCHLQNAK